MPGSALCNSVGNCKLAVPSKVVHQQRIQVGWVKPARVAKFLYVREPLEVITSLFK
jgi:hypothetical protein